MKRIRHSNLFHGSLQDFACYGLLVAFFGMICAANVAQADEQEEDQDEQKIEKRVEIRVEVDDEGNVKMSGLEDGEEIELSGVSDVIKKAIKLHLPHGLEGDVDAQLKVELVGDGDVAMPGMLLELLGEHGAHGKEGNRMRFLFKGDGDDEHAFEWHGKGDKPNVWVFQGEDGPEVQAFGQAMRLHSAPSGRYRLGVALEPVGAALRSHLGIDEEVGLMISQVMDDSPAEEIGLRRFDVLVGVGDDDVSSTDQSSLVAAIEAAGDAGDSLSIKYMREGKRQRARFTPQKTTTTSPTTTSPTTTSPTTTMMKATMATTTGMMMTKTGTTMKTSKTMR